MKIKCKNIYNECTKEFQDISPWLTIGKEYVVLEAIASASKGLLYRLIGDNTDKSPSVFIATQFEIISDLVPSNWEISIVNKSLIVVGPKAWRHLDFWDSCYDGEPGALEIYKREARIIFEEESAL